MKLWERAGRPRWTGWCTLLPKITDKQRSITNRYGRSTEPLLMLSFDLNQCSFEHNICCTAVWHLLHYTAVQKQNAVTKLSSDRHMTRFCSKYRNWVKKKKKKVLRFSFAGKYIHQQLFSECLHLWRNSKWCYTFVLVRPTAWNEINFRYTWYLQHNALGIEATNLTNYWRATNLPCISGLFLSHLCYLHKEQARLMYL